MGVEGCPGDVAVRWELDAQGRILRERRMHSVVDADRCVGDERLPEGWWTGRELPAGSSWANDALRTACAAMTREDLETVTEQIIEGDLTVELCNGTPVLSALVNWAMSRFYLAGLPLPVVRRVTFTRFTDFCPERPGKAIFFPAVDPRTGAEIAELVLCMGDADVYLDEHGAIPSLRTKYLVLHEFAHVWIVQHLDPSVRDGFVEWLDLPTWNDKEFAWDERGVEWAASFIGWGLLDGPMPLYELEVPPIEQRVEGFRMLTGVEQLLQPG